MTALSPSLLLPSSLTMIAEVEPWPCSPVSAAAVAAAVARSKAAAIALVASDSPPVAPTLCARGETLGLCSSSPARIRVFTSWMEEMAVAVMSCVCTLPSLLRLTFRSFLVQRKKNRVCETAESLCLVFLPSASPAPPLALSPHLAKTFPFDTRTKQQAAVSCSKISAAHITFASSSLPSAAVSKNAT